MITPTDKHHLTHGRLLQLKAWYVHWLWLAALLVCGASFGTAIFFGLSGGAA
jgi:hypothetical protein